MSEIKTIDPSIDLREKIQVRQINDNTEKLHEGLGITAERAEELNKIIVDAFMSCKDMVECGAKITKHCKHPNESFLCAITLANIQIHHERMNGMAALMNGMFGGFKNEGPK